MLLMYHMNINLREYLQKIYYRLTWKKRIEITNYIVYAIYKINSFNLTISNKYGQIIPCFGLTKDKNDNYMLVMYHMHMNLREYLQKNYYRLTWKKRIEITHDIVYALYKIHSFNAIHRDLHSGNILFH